MKKTASIGDIAEIKTPTGLGYVQYTHDNGDMGELVRVLPGLHASRPNLVQLASEKELYFVFYTLEYALRAGQTTIVAHEAIPEWARPYPLMRMSVGIDRTGKTLTWRIINAGDSPTIDALERLPILHELTPDQVKLSIHMLRSHPAMVKAMARGWTPDRAEELRLGYASQRKAEELSRPAEGMPSDRPMRHYLYFRSESEARKAAHRLRTRGFSAEVRLGGDGVNWLTLAGHAAPRNIEEMETRRDELVALATELGGEYDGYELVTETIVANVN